MIAARSALEKPMLDESRIAKLAAAVQHIHSDISEIKPALKRRSSLQ